MTNENLFIFIYIYIIYIYVYLIDLYCQRRHLAVSNGGNQQFIEKNTGLSI